MCIQCTCALYSIVHVMTWQSNPPISQSNSNEFTTFWSMFVYNIFSKNRTIYLNCCMGVYIACMIDKTVLICFLQKITSHYTWNCACIHSTISLLKNAHARMKNTCTDEIHVDGWNTCALLKYLCMGEIPVHRGIPVHGWNTRAWLKYLWLGEIHIHGWNTRAWLKYTCMSEIHVHGWNVLFTSTLLPYTTLRALLNYLWSFYVVKTINTKFLFSMFLTLSPSMQHCYFPVLTNLYIPVSKCPAFWWMLQGEVVVEKALFTKSRRYPFLYKYLQVSLSQCIIYQVTFKTPIKPWQ